MLAQARGALLGLGLVALSGCQFQFISQDTIQSSVEVGAPESYNMVTFNSVASRTKQHPYLPAAEDQVVVDELLAGYYPSGASTQGTLKYVAPPTPNQNAAQRGSGTKLDPYRDLITVLRTAATGDRIYLAPGLYKMNQIRDLFGHASSVVTPQNSGARGNPIVWSTDPAELDIQNGKIAMIDYQFGNLVGPGGGRGSCFWLNKDYWSIENLEIKNIEGRGFWLEGFNNVFRNNHFHHLNTPGDNNQAFILVAASGRPTNNLIYGNHFHHEGILNPDKTTITNYGGGNGACIYTETRQHYIAYYDTVFPSPTATPAPVLADYLAVKPPADSHLYVVNNYGHHCKRGFATKNTAEGPYFFLSNVVHDTDTGIKVSFSGSVVRNNIVYTGKDQPTNTAYAISNNDGGESFVSQYTNGMDMKVYNNTSVGASLAFVFFEVWNSEYHHNLIVDETEGHHPHRVQYYWYSGGSYPGLRGISLLGDLASGHPYFESLPSYLKEMNLKKGNLHHNAFTRPPVMAYSDSANNAEIQGRTFDTDFIVLTPAQRATLFVNEADSNFTLNPQAAEALRIYGARVTKGE